MSPTPLTNIRIKETWTKYMYTPLTLLSERKLALTARNTLFALYNKIIGATKKFKKWPLTLL
jgi:hypothetical protein